MAKDAPIIDGNLAHECHFTVKVFVLVITNALHAPSMDHDLMSPFIIRSGSIETNNMPKIHYEDPIFSDYSLF